jgi:hypothetical protein
MAGIQVRPYSCAPFEARTYAAVAAELYLEAQKAISRDATMSEAARISVLIDMTKSADNQVKMEAIRTLQEIQRSKTPIVIEAPKKNWLGF